MILEKRIDFFEYSLNIDKIFIKKIYGNKKYKIFTRF